MQEVVALLGQLWDWLGKNKDVTAVLVAIAIPVFQRAGESKDRKIREGVTAVSQYQAVFFLLCDIRNYLLRAGQMKWAPTGKIFQPSEQKDLLDRLHALEQRELDASGVVALFRARALLVLSVNSATNFVPPQATLDEGVEKWISWNAKRVEYFADDMHKRLRAAEYRLGALRRSWIFSFIPKTIMMVRARVLHDGGMVRESEFEAQLPNPRPLLSEVAEPIKDS